MTEIWTSTASSSGTEATQLGLQRKAKMMQIQISQVLLPSAKVLSTRLVILQAAVTGAKTLEGKSGTRWFIADIFTRYTNVSIYLFIYSRNAIDQDN